MSKLYDKYIGLKYNDKSTLYLFKSSLFPSLVMFAL